MTRHLVADLSFLVLRPGVAQRQGSQPYALVLSSALHISASSPTPLLALVLLLCLFEMLPWLRPHGRIGEYDLSIFPYHPDRKVIGQYGTK